VILRTLGVAGSAPRPNSAASTYLVHVPAADVSAGIAAGVIAASVAVRDWNIVVDLGNGGFGILQRHVDPFALDAVALSHLHPDHCVDLTALYTHLNYHPTQGLAATGKAPRMPVYGPEHTSERAGALFGSPLAEQVFDFRGWSDGVAVRVGPVEITPRAVVHPVDTFGMRIVGPSSRRRGREAVLAYSGDGDLSASLVKLARGADVLLCEASFIEGRDDAAEPGIHLTGARAGHLAVEADVSSLVLTHIPAWTDSAIVLAEAVEVYPGPVSLAQPDGELTL
jgi:ribonuclease BN (tRNA processing enzyme)